MTIIQKIRFMLTSAERKGALVSLCLMFIAMLLEMLGVGLLFPILMLMSQKDLATRYPEIQPALDFLGNPTHEHLIAGAMLVFVGVILAKNLFLAFFAWWQRRFVQRVRIQLSQRLFTAYLRQPYTFHLQRNSTHLIHNVSQVGTFAEALNECMTIVTEAAAIFGIAMLLLLAEPLGVLIVVLVVGAAVWGFSSLTRARITRWGTAYQHHSILRSLHLHQGFGGVKDIKLLGREKTFLAHFHLHNTQAEHAFGSKSILQQLPRLWLELLVVCGLAILVLSMVSQAGSMDRIVPTLGLFAAAAFRLLPSVTRIMGAAQSTRYSLPAVDLLYQEIRLTEANGRLAQEKSFASFAPLQTEIRLSNVSYVYPGALSRSLNDVSITIKKGESVGFIGPSGSGKSTLVDMILGLLPAGDGRVLVDGRDIQENLRAWQNQIGYVPQSIYLTDDTLRRNVAFGIADEEIDDAAVWKAIKDAQLEEFVASLPNALETIVGERGVRLSGGQRQRIGIARALYHDPAVLVLDEATSALDTATEHGVMQAVTALHGSKTLLIVAHRLSTVDHCDRLYRLEAGRVTAESSAVEGRVANSVAASS